MVTGVILAGGKASRMSENKMLLQYKNKPIIYHTIKSMITYCNKITIVTGFYQNEYIEVLKNFKNVEVVHNNRHEQGMFSSVKCAIDRINSDIFLIPGDYPLVKENTYKKLLDGDGPIRVPVFNGRRGHPIFISQKLLQNLKNEDISSNLKVWRDKHKVHYIEVADPGIIEDIDTKLDYQKLIERID